MKQNTFSFIKARAVDILIIYNWGHMERKEAKTLSFIKANVVDMLIILLLHRYGKEGTFLFI